MKFWMIYHEICNATENCSCRSDIQWSLVRLRGLTATQLNWPEQMVQDFFTNCKRKTFTAVLTEARSFAVMNDLPTEGLN